MMWQGSQPGYVTLIWKISPCVLAINSLPFPSHLSKLAKTRLSPPNLRKYFKLSITSSDLSHLGEWLKSKRICARMLCSQCVAEIIVLPRKGSYLWGQQIG